MAKSMEEIAGLLGNTRFKRRLFGGVDEDDVWRKLERLQAEYASLIEEERLKNQGVVEEWQRHAAAYQRKYAELQRRSSQGSAGESPRETAQGPPDEAAREDGDIT